MHTLEIFDRNTTEVIATLNTEFYPVPLIESIIYVNGKTYIVEKIFYDFDECTIRVMVGRR